MDQDYLNFEELYFKYINGTITPKERTHFIEILKSNSFENLFPFIEGGERFLKSRISDDQLRAMPEFSEIFLEVVKKKRRSHTTWFRIAATVLVLVITGLFIFTFTKHRKNDRRANIQTSAKVFKGLRYIVLPDDSKVYLNEKSELRYDSDFGINGREVFLKGEAFFDVTHQEGSMFKVHVGEVTTTVLGTAFNVSSMNGDNEVEVTVVRGKVEVRGPRGNSEFVLPDQQALVRKNQPSIDVEFVEGAVVTQWRNRIIVFESNTLGEVLQKIGEQYNVQINVSDPAMKNCLIAMVLYNNESLREILDVICALHYFKYTIQPNGVVELTGKGC